MKQTNLPFLLLTCYLGYGMYFKDLNPFVITALAGLFGAKLFLDHIEKPDYIKPFEDEVLLLNKKLEDSEISKLEQIQDNTKEFKKIINDLTRQFNKFDKESEEHLKNLSIMFENRVKHVEDKISGINLMSSQGTKKPVNPTPQQRQDYGW